MKFKLRWLIFLVLLIGLTPLSASAAKSSSWSTFGKDQQRTREAVAQFTQPPLYLKWQVPKIGWSISQPIVANKHIYHQAGGYLYKIPLNFPFVGKSISKSKLLKRGAKRKKISNKYKAASHPVYDPYTNSIYVGTGNNRIRKINPNTLKIQRTYKGGGRLVNAPTILGKNLIAYGNGKAKIYLFKGKKRKPISLGSSPMEITGTFAVKKGKNPIIFVPVNYKGLNRSGFVDAFRVIDRGKGKAPTYKPIWRKSFKTKNGVSASIVYDEKKDRIYFADKSGTVYAVNAKNGKQVWRNTKFSSKSATRTLVNNSPALAGNTLVVPYRYLDGRNKGMIVAFNKNTGKKKWKRTSAGKKSKYGKYNGEISSAPAINTDGDGNSIVMVGTTKGNMRAYNLKNGKKHFITEKNGKKKYVLDAVGGKSSSIYQGKGIATEIMIAEGHLIFGANTSANPNKNGTNGRLYAYSTPWATNHPSKDLSGRLYVPDTVPRTVPLKIYYTPTNIGTQDIKKSFSVRLYANDVLIDEREFDGLKVGGEKGRWIDAPPKLTTNRKGKFDVKLVVDYHDDIDEAVEDNNVIRNTYRVTAMPPINCPGDGKWDGEKCVEKWTEHEVRKNHVRPILIR